MLFPEVFRWCHTALSPQAGLMAIASSTVVDTTLAPTICHLARILRSTSLTRRTPTRPCPCTTHLSPLVATEADLICHPMARHTLLPLDPVGRKVSRCLVAFLEDR